MTCRDICFELNFTVAAMDAKVVNRLRAHAAREVLDEHAELLERLAR